MKSKVLLMLGCIVFVAALLRFVGISNNPPSLTWDEAAWGYNAYSIGIDGRDEFGRFLPLTYIESFGDFKPPVYAYLTVLPVKIFGLNEFSTRLASAFFGVLTVLLTYFLVRELFPNNKSPALGFLSAGIMSISPWHILLSRAAFEANVATFFIILGVYLFLVSKRLAWMLPLSVLSFVISMYTFNTARIVSPLLLIGLVIANREYLLKIIPKQLITSVIFGGIIFLPLFLFLLTPQAKLRFNEVNIFSDSEIVKQSNQQIQNDNNAFWSKIIHNRRVGYSIEYLKHYFDNLSPSFLFIKGDGNPKFSIQDVGEMYIFEIPFFIAGILFLFKRKEGHWWFIPYWIVVGIIPAATARETPHALRIETILPTFQILVAYGIYNFALIIKNLNIKLKVYDLKNSFYLLGLMSYVLFTIFNISYFLHTYFIHYPKQYSNQWQFGYRDAINYTKQNEDKFNNIIFTDYLGRPYIYVLFYKKFHPEKFRKEAKVDREALGFVHVRSFQKYKFVESVTKSIDRGQKNLYIDKPWDVPEGAVVLQSFKELDGNTTLVAYTL